MKANQLTDFFAQRVRNERKSFFQESVRSTTSAWQDVFQIPEEVALFLNCHNHACEYAE
jgi:hypothetical protein